MALLARATLLTMILLVGCAGPEPASAPAPTTEAATAVEPLETDGDATEGADEELPLFLADFDRVCTTQVGYPGASRHADTPAPHPVALFEEHRDDGDFLETSRDLPAGWGVEQDTDFEDNSELAAVQLVACLEQLTATPNGTQCEFDSEGTPRTLELVDGTFELRVYAATTGEQLAAVPLEASGTECPMFVSMREGDTTHFNRVPDEDIINALKAHVAG